jgi:hypothetical protein
MAQVNIVNISCTLEVICCRNILSKSINSKCLFDQISGYSKPSESNGCARKDLTLVDMFSFSHKPPATFPAGIESHGGEDVGLWAKG